mmetsp:Transcript_46901/g.118179  ORF Transcript_46901/g.118179 Transcript_46901/m.118179 type:complete len:233 (-) Transcript_46901:1461-2159(-)
MLDGNLRRQDGLHAAWRPHGCRVWLVGQSGLRLHLEILVLVTIVCPPHGHGHVPGAVAEEPAGIHRHCNVHRVHPARRVETNLIVELQRLAATDEPHIVQALVLNAHRSTELLGGHRGGAGGEALSGELAAEAAARAGDLDIDAVLGDAQDEGNTSLCGVAVLVRADDLPLVPIVRDAADRLRLHVEVVLAASFEAALRRQEAGLHRCEADSCGTVLKAGGVFRAGASPPVC